MVLIKSQLHNHSANHPKYLYLSFSCGAGIPARPNRKVEESNFYSISTALWYSKPVAIHIAAPSKPYKKERKIEVSNPQVLPCPSFRGWLPSLEQYLPLLVHLEGTAPSNSVLSAQRLAFRL